jgi:hypothetical protein
VVCSLSLLYRTKTLARYYTPTVRDKLDERAQHREKLEVRAAAFPRKRMTNLILSFRPKQTRRSALSLKRSRRNIMVYCAMRSTTSPRLIVCSASRRLRCKKVMYDLSLRIMMMTMCWRLWMGGIRWWKRLVMSRMFLIRSAWVGTNRDARLSLDPIWEGEFGAVCFFFVFAHDENFLLGRVLAFE